MSVEGSKELEKTLDRMATIDGRKQVEYAILAVRSAAVLGCPVNTGELRQNILTSMETDGDIVRGTCYTNKTYGVYVEFGTGPEGQQNHMGISPDASPAYTLSPWWIHESQIDKRMAEMYQWFYIDTPDGRFYQCTGMAARPFMYPALKSNRDGILKDMAARFEVEIKEAVK